MLERFAQFSSTISSIYRDIQKIENGEISLLGKAHGSKQGNHLLVRQIEAAGAVAVAFYAPEHGKNGCTPEEPGV